MPGNPHVEKPHKVLADQYVAADTPPIAGVCTLAHDPFPDGRPHAHTVTQPVALHDTDVLIWNFYHPDQLDAVLPLAEFEDRFGPGPV